MSKKTGPNWDDPGSDDAAAAELVAHPTAEPARAPPPPTPNLVRVKCISKARPWSDKKALEFGEEADVPADVADAMKRKGFVE